MNTDDTFWIQKWKEQGLYKKILEKNAKNKEFVFLDGPPFISSNTLHHGHLAISTIKSIVFNYMSMNGYLCKVKLGYDCHGLPIVNKAAEENNLKTLEEIEELGIRKFNKLCDDLITKYEKSWTPIFERIGRLTDFEDKYMTRDLNYMETCLWIFKEFYKKGLVYRGKKVMAYSYKNRTPLSNFEASLNYKTKRTKSIYVKIKFGENFLVIWTTTPWTLFFNKAICVNEDFDYVLLDNNCIVGKDSVKNIFKKASIVKTFKGKELVGKKYEKIYGGYGLIVSDSYVKKDSIGSELVHLAPAFGEDDFRICSKFGIVDNVNNECELDDSCNYKGKLILDYEEEIVKELKDLIVKTEVYEHSYPYCWRSDTPLIYRTTESYFIKVTEVKDKIIEFSKKVNWYNESSKNRFNSWLSDCKDWSISRNTSYATPLPVWRSDDGEEIVIGSIEELNSLSKTKVNNLHPEYLNDIVIVKNEKKYFRIKDTFDCWFESGCAPFGQAHYPFENKDIVEREFMSDLVCEGVDQTRGWFYTLLVISAGLFDKVPYKNVICTGLILDKNGKKLSKKLNNFVNPLEHIEKYGADVMRMYYVRSNLSNAKNLNFEEKHIADIKRRIIPYLNAVKFYKEYLKWFRIKSKRSLELKEFKSLIDQWMISKLKMMTCEMKESMNEFKFNIASKIFLDFIEDLTNWYIKINRNRINGKCGLDEQNISLIVLRESLRISSILISPICPFIAEYVHSSLENEKSVLLENYPDFEEYDKEIIRNFEISQSICKNVRNFRDQRKIKHIVPLKSLTISCNHGIKESIKTIEKELNCLEIKFKEFHPTVIYTPKWKDISKIYKKESKFIIEKIKNGNIQDIDENLYEKEISNENEFSINIDDTYNEYIHLFKILERIEVFMYGTK